MSTVIRLKKGLDINLVGSAEKVISQAAKSQSYSVTPSDYVGVTPKMLVAQGDKVKAGTPLFFDKYRPQVLFTSPVSGTLESVVRGDKRKILEVLITPDAEIEYLPFNVSGWQSASRDGIIDLMLSSGMWPMVIQRPYGVIANPADRPKAIFVSGLDTSPLAPDVNFLIQNESKNLNAGIAVLKKLTDGAVNLTISDTVSAGVLTETKGAEVHHINGPHPAGNVGIHIHHINPINKGEVVWTIDIQHLVMLGRFFETGKVDMSKVIALTGSEITKPQYYKVISGASVLSIVDGKITRKEGIKPRILNGNPLTGSVASRDGYLAFYTNQITVLPEGDKYEFLGWAMPRFHRFSVSKSYFSWLCPKKKYDLDTNLNGGQRAFVMSGIYDKVLPMDIYPVYLLKAILAGDIDKMENLGIYEVVEEDFALCEFVDPSKMDIQQIVRNGLNLMIKELS